MSAFLNGVPRDVRQGLSVQELSDLTGTNELVVVSFLRTHGKGYTFFYGPDALSIRIAGDRPGEIGAAMLPVPPTGRQFQNVEARRENWWFLLGYVIGFRQGGGK